MFFLFPWEGIDFHIFEKFVNSFFLKGNSSDFTHNDQFTHEQDYLFKQTHNVFCGSGEAP